MAKVTGPLMSISASGSYANTLVYATWKGIQYCREWVLPQNPNSSAQQVIRGYFQDAVAAWEAESSGVKTDWNNYVSAHGMAESGYNLFVGAYIDFLIANSGTPPSTTNSPPNMS